MFTFTHNTVRTITSKVFASLSFEDQALCEPGKKIGEYKATIPTELTVPTSKQELFDNWDDTQVTIDLPDKNARITVDKSLRDYIVGLKLDVNQTAGDRFTPQSEKTRIRHDAEQHWIKADMAGYCEMMASTPTPKLRAAALDTYASQNGIE